MVPSRYWASKRWESAGDSSHLGLDCRHQRLDADDVQYTCEIVGQYTEGHLGGDLRQRLRQEVRCTHPHLHCTERMLDRLTARAHGVRIFVEPLLHGLGQKQEC